MKAISITWTDGGWIYTVSIAGRPVIVGRARTHERAFNEASLA